MALKKFGWFLLVFLLAHIAQAKTYKYTRIGQKSDIQTKTSPGIAMMGGGSDLDEAFHWLWPSAFAVAQLKLQPFLPGDVERESASG